MDRRLIEWKVAADSLWSAAAFDFDAAASLVAQIARESEDPSLKRAAVAAVPSLRTACLPRSGAGTKDFARRRFGTVLNCLHVLGAPRFGKRTVDVATAQDSRSRKLLGLPLGRRLNAPEIHRAYKLSAKTMHPDVGGDERMFLELCAARDTLMKNVD